MQVNHDQCEKLYQIAMDSAKLTKSMNVIDAYCGIGTITLNIAKRVNSVLGIEVVEDAINNANKNKEINKITNASFICGKCEDVITSIDKKNNYDVIFVDPPRKGCEISFLRTVIDMKIKKLIYISCNPATMARDIKILESSGYELEIVIPVDQFPRTNNIETIAILSLKK